MVVAIVETAGEVVEAVSTIDELETPTTGEDVADTVVSVPITLVVAEATLEDAVSVME